MKIFVTGAGGFIGRAFCREAARHGHDLLCLDRNGSLNLRGSCRIVSGDICDAMPWKEVEAFSPDAVLHLAWDATPGEYLHSEKNSSLLEQSQAMIAGLVERGITHAAVAGTCIEYAPSSEPLDEFNAPKAPSAPYSIAKHRLFEWLCDSYPGPEPAWCWLRIFYPYGPGEHPDKITTSFARTLAKGEPVILKTPGSVKDFIYIDDLASALLRTMETRLAGPVNLGTGTGISIQAIATKLAELLDVPASLVQSAGGSSTDPAPVMIARADRIRSTGWQPEVAIDGGLARLVESLNLHRKPRIPGEAFKTDHRP